MEDQVVQHVQHSHSNGILRTSFVSSYDFDIKTKCYDLMVKIRPPRPPVVVVVITIFHF